MTRSSRRRSAVVIPSVLLGGFVAWTGCSNTDQSSPPAGRASSTDTATAASDLARNGGTRDLGLLDDLRDLIAQRETLRQGQHTFRFDTFGDEAFWGDTLHLHQAIEGSAHGGVGDGVSPKAALGVGLKVDAQSLPRNVLRAIQNGTANLDDPATTLSLLQSNSVVGVTGFFDTDGSLKSIGIQCAFCHSTVDDSVAPGIGKRLDGWANRDLNVGAIINLAPDVSAFTRVLGVSEATVRSVLSSWGPGKFDAELILDGKGARPDGKSSATLIPPAFGLAGVNLHTYTGWGSIPYWNAFVAVLEMHGVGNFFDPRLDDATKFPVAARNKFGHVTVSPDDDRVTPKLGSLQQYQLSIAAPTPPAGSFDRDAAERGDQLFENEAKCVRCHVEPQHTEPGWNLHTPEEIGIDDFQSSRAPDDRYRTTPLKGLWTHQKGGFFHDGRFATLLDVVNHYDQLFSLGLTDAQKNDLVEYLKSI
jgi:hypothetical protein